MKAIIIEDKDCQDLLRRLELKKFENIDTASSQAVREIHRQFHYEVVRWLQEQGFTTNGNS